jgi:hypothetical protein
MNAYVNILIFFPQPLYAFMSRCSVMFSHVQSRQPVYYWLTEFIKPVMTEMSECWENKKVDWAWGFVR